MLRWYMVQADRSEVAAEQGTLSTWGMIEASIKCAECGCKEFERMMAEQLKPKVQWNTILWTNEPINLN